MNGPKRFRKKPVEVKAIQYRPDIPNCAAVARFLGWGEQPVCDEEDHAGATFTIPAPEGAVEASPGDWIIRGVHGEFYVCKPNRFATTYEEVAS